MLDGNSAGDLHQGSYIGRHDLLVPSEARELVEKRLAHLTCRTITADNVVPSDARPASRRLDLDRDRAVVLLHVDDLVSPLDLALVLCQKLVEHQAVQLVQHQTRGAQVLAVDVLEHAAVKARQGLAVVRGHAPPGHGAGNHALTAHLVEDAGALQIRYRRRAVNGRAGPVVEVVGRLQEDHRDAMFCQEEAQEQSGRTGSDDNDLLS